MASIELRPGDTIDAATVSALVHEAVRLNRAEGDPTKLA